MTTIVWDGKTLAADSRETCNGIITSDEVEKIHMVDPSDHFFDGKPVIALATAGSVGGSRILKALLSAEGGLSALTPVDTGVDFSAIIIFANGKAFWLYTDDDFKVVLGEVIQRETIGSGSQFARSALALGMSATDAVEHAKKFDTNTGGTVDWFTYTASDWVDKINEAQ